MGHDERTSKNSVLHAVLPKPGGIQKNKTRLGRPLNTALQDLDFLSHVWVWIPNSLITQFIVMSQSAPCCIYDQLNNLWDSWQTEVKGPLIQKAGSLTIVKYKVFSSLLGSLSLRLSRPVICLVFHVCSLVHRDLWGASADPSLQPHGV